MSPAPEIPQQVVVLPPVGATVRHALPNIVEGSVVPLLLFYATFRVAGAWWALAVALAWSVGTVARRVAGGGRMPGILVLGAVGTTVRTVIAVLSGSVFVYFLQPTLGTVAMAGAFLASVAVRRPMIERLVRDVLPLPDGFCADPRVRPLFVRLTLAWAVVHLANAGLTVWLLLSQPLEVYVVARAAAAGVLTAMAIAGSTVWFVRAAARRGVAVRFRPSPAGVAGTGVVPAPVLASA